MHPKILIPIKSSALSGAHYNDGTRELTVEFPSGRRYIYHGVTREKFDSLLTTESAGNYFAKNIRNLHTATKVGQ